MADTVKRIEEEAFFVCTSLKFVKFSRNLEYIGHYSFYACQALVSVFIPPSCREIDRRAFYGCTKLIILSVPQHTCLGKEIIDGAELLKACPVETEEGTYDEYNEAINDWIRNLNIDPDDKYALHRVCSAFNPRADDIYEIMRRVGVQAFREPNLIGITPAEYLEANYYAQFDQTKIINRYILDLMGETV